jgi:hypothetical protein
MSTPHSPIPTQAELREQIRERITEVRALRRLLRFAEAAETAAQARGRCRPLKELTGEVPHAHR